MPKILKMLYLSIVRLPRPNAKVQLRVSIDPERCSRAFHIEHLTELEHLTEMLVQVAQATKLERSLSNFSS